MKRHFAEYGALQRNQICATAAKPYGVAFDRAGLNLRRYTTMRVAAILTCLLLTVGAGNFIWASDGGSSANYLPFFARIFAHLARCAAAILLRPAAEMVCFLRVGLLPAYTPTNAASAAFKPDNCRSTLSRSFLSCFTSVEMVAIWFPLTA